MKGRGQVCRVCTGVNRLIDLFDTGQSRVPVPAANKPDGLCTECRRMVRRHAWTLRGEKLTEQWPAWSADPSIATRWRAKLRGSKWR